MSRLDDLHATEALRYGDNCEYRTWIDPTWKPGMVLRNGGSSYWHVVGDTGEILRGLYIEHVRAPGTDPWFS